MSDLLGLPGLRVSQVYPARPDSEDAKEGNPPIFNGTQKWS